MSDYRNIDELFKEVLDQPVQGANANAAWSSFEKMQGANSAGAVFKTAWIAALSSFFLFSLAGLFQLKSPETTAELKQVYTPSPMSILIFDKASTLASEIVESNSSSQESIAEAEVPKSSSSVLLNVIEPSDNHANTGTSNLDLVEERAFSSTHKEANFTEASEAHSDLALMDLRPIQFAGFEQEQLKTHSSEEPVSILDLNERKHHLKLVVSSNTFDALVGKSTEGIEGRAQQIGLEYQYDFSPKLGVSLSALYAQMSVASFSNNYDSTAFSFGSETYRTSIKPIYTQNINLPIALVFRPRARHELKLGAELSALLNTQSKLERSVLGQEGEVPVVSEYARGYKQGFKDVNANLIVAYRYNINPMLQFGANGRYAITDRISESYFDRNKKQSPFMWQLAIAYNIGSK